VTGEDTAYPLNKNILTIKRAMTNIFKTIPLAIFFFLSICSISIAGEFKVTRVSDGDTIKAQGHDIEIKVRLFGIDTPETGKGKRKPGQPYSQRAKKYLAKMVLNKVVDVKGYGMGPYNRVLGVIYLNQKNINLEMVKAGLAEVYRGREDKENWKK